MNNTTENPTPMKHDQFNQVLADMIKEQELRTQRASQKLLARSTQIAKIAAQTTELVNAGNHVSEYGELQTAGLNFDLACAEYETAHASLRILKVQAEMLREAR